MSTNTWFIFVVGLLVGWLIEWVIDWLYWRRKCKDLEARLRLAEEAAVVLETDLQQIRGIGPVIAQKLNEAGIFTFAQLAQLTASQLAEIVGEEIHRLADEEEILRQAREFARRTRK
ncbi:MAG: hypothetical protein GXO37_05460 [Chloroflexi bacterium]|nr:hypothetical protein [Chloroflexota bacterium]